MEKGRHWKATFRERFCEQYKCAPADFEREVFFRCVHWHGQIFARLLYRKDPAIFKEDLDFIHEVGGVRDPFVFKSEVNRFHGRNVRERGWIRGVFVIRVSAMRAINLKNKLFRPPASED